MILVLNGPCAGKRVHPAVYERSEVQLTRLDDKPRCPRHTIRFTLSLKPSHKTTVVYHLVSRERVDWAPRAILEPQEPSAPAPTGRRTVAYYYALPDTIRSDADVADALERLLTIQTDHHSYDLDDRFVPMQDMLLSGDEDTREQAAEMLRAMPEHAPDVALALVNEVRKVEADARQARSADHYKTKWAKWELVKIVSKLRADERLHRWSDTASAMRYANHSLVEMVAELQELLP